VVVPVRGTLWEAARRCERVGCREVVFEVMEAVRQRKSLSFKLALNTSFSKSLYGRSRSRKSLENKGGESKFTESEDAVLSSGECVEEAMPVNAWFDSQRAKRFPQSASSKNPAVRNWFEESQRSVSRGADETVSTKGAGTKVPKQSEQELEVKLERKNARHLSLIMSRDEN